MIKQDIVVMAMKNLSRRKGRTFLTMLGVLIGTTSIVVMVSLGLGLQASYQAMFEQWGSLNQVTVTAPNRFGGDIDQQNPIVLNDATVATMREMEGVTAAIPMLEVNGSTKYGKKDGSFNIVGIDAEGLQLLGFETVTGRIFDASDRNVLLLGSGISDQFYDVNDPNYWNNYEYDPKKIYEETQNMQGTKFKMTFQNWETEKKKVLNLQVVGVLTDKTPGASWYAYAPMKDMMAIKKLMMTKDEKKQKNRSAYDKVVLIAEDVTYAKQLTQDLTDQGYYADCIATQLEGIEQETLVIEAVLGGIGSITLLVAAIGIINTMIMSIYERTKEIAIMKVIGATFGDIRMLFLTEAGLIGLGGGIFGLIFSYGLSYLINQVSGDFLGTGTTVGISQIPWWLAVFALLFSMSIGVLAGVYPANRAVKLSPIEAMRN